MDGRIFIENSLNMGRGFKDIDHYLCKVPPHGLQRDAAFMYGLSDLSIAQINRTSFLAALTGAKYK